MKTIYLTLIMTFIGGSIIGQCNPNLQAHVYHPNRLTVIDNCKTITGIVYSVKAEPDGDYHIDIKLDDGQPDLLNDKNNTVQHGCLVVEVICAHKVTQQDAIESCADCKNTVLIPKKGQHVKVTGTYINDTEANHGWNELHPVSSLVVID